MPVLDSTQEDDDEVKVGGENCGAQDWEKSENWFHLALQFRRGSREGLRLW